MAKKWDRRIVRLTKADQETVLTVIMSHKAAGWELVRILYKGDTVKITFKRERRQNDSQV